MDRIDGRKSDQLRSVKITPNFTKFAEGSVLIEEFSLAIEKGLSLEDIALSIHAHPTLSELAMETCKLALGLAFDK